MTKTPKSSAKAAKHGAADAIHPVSRYFLWLESKAMKIGTLMVLGLAAIGLGLFDLVHARHEYVSWAELHGFYAWFGFAALAIAVLMGWPLRALLGRPRDYYDKAGEDD